jgi:glycosyltransferase involved in cell wall biosynthesis
VNKDRLTVIQVLPALEAGGVERGTVEVAAELARRGHRALVISRGGRLVQELQDAGAEHLALDIGAKSPFTLRHVVRLRRLFCQGVHIVHARSRLPAWISYLALRGLDPASRPVFITSVHGPYTVNAYSRIMTRGEVVIAISGFIHDYIRENYPGTDPARITVIPRGVDPVRFPYGYRPPPDWQARWQSGTPPLAGRYVLSLPARITRWKGQEDFLRLITALRGRGLDACGLVVGGTEPRRRRFLRELQALAATLGVREHVHFLGHRDDLREIMSVSDIVFSLSREPEAFGRTSLEALSLGVPVIAYDHGGAGEVLQAIFPAGRVTPGNHEAAAALAAEFLQRRPVVPDRNPFTLQRMLAATIEVYEGAWAERHGP